MASNARLVDMDGNMACGGKCTADVSSFVHRRAAEFRHVTRHPQVRPAASSRYNGDQHPCAYNNTNDEYRDDTDEEDNEVFDDDRGETHVELKPPDKWAKVMRGLPAGTFSVKLGDTAARGNPQVSPQGARRSCLR
jgi:hypothetical protein